MTTRPAAAMGPGTLHPLTTHPRERSIGKYRQVIEKRPREENMETPDLRLEWLTPEQAGAIIGFDREWIIKNLASDENPDGIPKARFGRDENPNGIRYKIRRADLDAWMSSHA